LEYHQGRRAGRFSFLRSRTMSSLGHKSVVSSTAMGACTGRPSSAGQGAASRAPRSRFAKDCARGAPFVLRTRGARSSGAATTHSTFSDASTTQPPTVCLGNAISTSIGATGFPL
jgi:hypothetical protein